MSIRNGDCENFVIKKPENVPKFLDSLRDQEFKSDEQYLHEFKLISSYLLFFATASPAPTSSQFISQLSDLIRKAGSAANIAFWLVRPHLCGAQLFTSHRMDNFTS